MLLPSKMPREKALIVENANLRRENLTLAAQRMQDQIDAIQVEVDAAVAERDAILREFNIDPTALGTSVKVNAKTGVITRTKIEKK